MSAKFALLFALISITTLSAQNSYRDLCSEKWTFHKEKDSVAYPAKVPGTVHTDLFYNSLIPDPFYANNEKKLQWIEEENWVYSTNFFISDSEYNNSNIDLVWDGLDTDAEVYLNGNKLLVANNMFRKWTIAAKKHLKKGDNFLKVIFYSSVQKAKEEAQKLPYTLPEKERVFVRKAQYQFGWDWGPRFVTAGIWKKVQLKFWNSAKIENIKYSQIELNDKKAVLEFTTEIYVSKVKTIQLKINDKYQTFNLKKGKNKIKMQYEITNPKLWWCNGLGDANLYPFTVEISQKNQFLDLKKLNIGLRIIELVQEKDAKGKSFYFRLNGKPVFMKGANYVPPDSFLPRITPHNYFDLVRNAKKANMNMLRVWGGGVYAEDAFYDACDANGILVWQDFMFACAMYPGDANFIANVKQEAIDNVNRLQNHPSIALWCGNNENEEGWHNWGWQKQFHYTAQDSTVIWKNYQKVFQDVLPKTLDSLVSKDKNWYWPSSPSIGWGRKESLLQGDSHYWGVWWGKEPFEVYTKKIGRFMSEYGFQGMPSWNTLVKSIPKEELTFASESFQNHQKHPTGFATITEYMQRDYNVPKSMENYGYVSQLLQANGMQTAIEAHRRAKPYCMGTLYWQYNDCWPVTSWSSIDYYGNWKALQYYVKRSYENVLLSVQKEKDSYAVYLCNDTSKDIKENLQASLISFDGKILWKDTKLVEAKGDVSAVIYTLPESVLEDIALRETVLVLQLGTVTSYYYFVKPKDFKLSKPTISIRKLDAVTFEITSNVLAKDVYLYSEEEVFLEDNFLDILPNEKRIIKADKPVEILKVKSLYDTLE